VPVRAIAAIPPTVALIGAALLIVLVLSGIGAGRLVTPDAALAPFLWFGGAVGAGLGLARTARRVIPAGSRGVRAVRHGVAAVGFVVAAGAVMSGLTTIADPGIDSAPISKALLDGTAPAGPASSPGSPVVDDAGLPGPFTVTTFTYGSGTDRRPAFGADVLLQTPTVDASRALDALGGGADELRRLAWGFGTDALPLNARVWMPEGDGPFPLVLVVHGNHAMGVENEAGYAYLAEHLASRGFITASVDESFLNGSWAGDYGGGEQDVRAWMLLLHLDQWRAWNRTAGSPLEGRVQLDRVALVGHSRGGEAAAVAASLADLDGSFNPILRPWPTGLRVRAVVAIAPSDGQYGPAVRLDGVDLLEITGGHDADARAWSGIRQYNRTTPRAGGFKAAFYALRANHGQFNSRWGRGDHGPWSGAVLNLRPLLAEEDQRDVARTAIGAFLEASLHDRAAYRGLFTRPMTGRAWLPDDVYLVRSDDGGASPLVDVAGSGAAAADLETVSNGLTSARGGLLPLRALQADQGARGVVLAWDAGPGEAAWGVGGIAGSGAAPVGDGIELRLELANATAPASEGMRAAAAGVIDPVVEVTSTDGVTVALPLSTWGALPPPLETRLVKDGPAANLAAISGIDLTLRSSAEVVVQGYVIPLAAFAAADPAFVPAHLDGVVLRISRATAGRIAVAGFGLATGER
jgi:dienelactone hydrolase